MANRPCSFIKAGGERCRGIATGGAEYCYSHDPARAAERSRNARKAGRTGGNGRSSGLSEVAEGKRYVRGLVARLLKGDVGRDTATAAFMGLNTLARFLELERKIRETEDLERRIEVLEEGMEQRRNGGYGYGAS